VAVIAGIVMTKCSPATGTDPGTIVLGLTLRPGKYNADFVGITKKVKRLADFCKKVANFGTIWPLLAAGIA
jgi:hypothetical protein